MKTTIEVGTLVQLKKEHQRAFPNVSICMATSVRLGTKRIAVRKIGSRGSTSWSLEMWEPARSPWDGPNAIKAFYILEGDI